MDLKKYIEYCFIEGTERENQCKRVIESLGYVMNKTEYVEDRYKHIDFRLTGLNDTTYIFDFKGDKEGHKLGLDGYTWIETKNVEGNIGWFYAENLNSLMFELPDRYILVDIDGLRKFCGAMLSIINETSVLKPVDDYILYQRYGRLDEMFRMPFSHMTKYIIESFYK